MVAPLDPVARHRIQYLDHAAASDPGREYKASLLERLDLRPGLAVLDVGCGPGTDLSRMADAVGGGGRVIGVDHDPSMAAEARRRLRDDDRVEIRTGDAHALPFDAAAVDRARIDRVLQHVADPERVLAELRRVVRPQGMIGLAEPDWDTLFVDDGDVEMSRCYTRFVATHVVRNGTIGRQLARLATEAGFAVRSVDVKPVFFREYAAGDRILRTASVAERAIAAGAMPADAAKRWLESIASGPFLAGFTFFMITAVAP